MEKLIDFSEPILRLVLPILLKDQTTGKNIIWATDPPPNVDCGPMGEITIEQLDRIKLVPRVQKRLSEQKKRTKGKAEVFTPLWVVKKMADHAEQELNKGNWEQFVHERCLEITCGEAPFLTSRYDPTTGEPVAIPDRVGILDRKLRKFGKSNPTRCSAPVTALRRRPPMVKPEPWENPMLDTMWSFMQMGGLKANYPALKEACMELRQMLMQKTAGQRKDRPKDLSWENLERVKVTIICESMALVLSGDYEKMEAQHDS